MADDFYQRLQAALVAWAAEQPAIRTILLVGSRARQIRPADEYSDLDISFYVSDDPGSVSELSLAWMRAFAPVWMILDEHHDNAKSWLILYQGGFKVDLGVVPLTELSALADAGGLWDDQQRGYQVLLDRDGVAARLLPPQPFVPPAWSPPTADQFQKRVESYFYGAVYTAKQIRRGNLWKAKWADAIQQRMLLDMLEWHAHATHAEPVDTYYRGDFMREWVSGQTWAELHGVFAHFDADDSWRALLASVRLFTRLTTETAGALRWDYPQTMMTEVTRYIDMLHQG